MSSVSPDRWGERLPRRLGLWSAVAVLVGTTIGSGIFRTPAVVAERVDLVVLFAAGWIAGGVLALCGALTFAELAALFPRTGGMYVYIREGFGRLPAFLFGWAELLIIRPAALGAIAVVSAEYFWRLLGVDGGRLLEPLPTSLAQVTAAVFIVVVGAVNYVGVQHAALLQNVSTVLKVGALLALVALGSLLVPQYPLDRAVSEPAAAALSPLAGFGLALVAILWAYDGWADVAFVSGEVKDPQRNLPRALFLGTASVAAVYLAVNAVYLRLIPLERMPGSPLIAADAAQIVLGSAGVVFVSASVMVSAFGALNGSMLVGSRIFYAMAEDRLFFRSLARVHPRYATPSAAIVLAAALGIVFVSVRTFGELADQFIIGIWPFYALAVGATFVLRKRLPDVERPYRTWGYPVVPVLFLLAALFLLANYMISEPLLFWADVAVILSGVPVYFLWVRRKAYGP
ncbi:MAG: amino acid transporter [Gemmatimonadales bacterium]|nr:MAG: amino acid transporter [Gemmatimonadales bacterium]